MRDFRLREYGDGEMEIEISKNCRFADQRLHHYSLFSVPCSLLYIINPILIRQFGIGTFRAFDKVLT
ncbi:MAG: hypothetical protein F6K44_25355 [Moorea sp. SIO3E2]|nr:hypothetical protein [Moorena sp. SIO3E2]